MLTNIGKEMRHWKNFSDQHLINFCNSLLSDFQFFLSILNQILWCVLHWENNFICITKLMKLKEGAKKNGDKIIQLSVDIFSSEYPVTTKLARAAALQSVAVRRSTGNDVSGPLFSPLFSIFSIFSILRRDLFS